MRWPGSFGRRQYDGTANEDVAVFVAEYRSQGRAGNRAKGKFIMNHSRTRKSIANLLFSLADQILVMAVSLVTRTVFIRVFSVRYLGLNAVFGDVLGLLSLADLGLGTAMNYSFYRPLAEGDERQLAALTHFYQKLYQYIAAFIAVLGTLMIPFLPFVVDVEFSDSRLILYYLFSLVQVVVSYLYCSRMAILSADQKNYISTGIGMAVSVLRMIFQLAAMLYLKSYIAYLAVGAGCSLFKNILASRAAFREYPFIRQRAELSSTEKKGIYRNVGSVFLYKVSSLLLNATDNILISVLVSTVAVGLYSNYLMLQSRLSGFISLLFTSLTASVGNLIVKEGVQRRYEIFQCEQTVSFLICAVAVPCYVVLSGDFVSVWLGEEYMLPGLTVYAMGLNLYLGCVLQPLWSYREATGLYAQTKWVMTVCAVFNIVLSIVLGMWLGTAGILFASSVSRLATYVWYEPRILFQKYFNENVKLYFRQMIRNVILTAGLTICLERIGAGFLAASWNMWFVKAILTGGSCLLVSGVVYGRSEYLALLWGKLKSSLQTS